MENGGFYEWTLRFHGELSLKIGDLMWLNRANFTDESDKYEPVWLKLK